MAKALFSNKGKGNTKKQPTNVTRYVNKVKNSFTKPSPKTRQLRPS